MKHHLCVTEPLFLVIPFFRMSQESFLFSAVLCGHSSFSGSFKKDVERHVGSCPALMRMIKMCYWKVFREDSFISSFATGIVLVLFLTVS